MNSLIGSFLILFQLICVHSLLKNVQNDLTINIVDTKASNVTRIDPDDFINGLFAKASLEKIVSSGYKKTTDSSSNFETAETSGKFFAFFSYMKTMIPRGQS